MKMRGLLLGLAILAVTLTGCFHDGLNADNIDWDRSPDAEIISATFCCGFTTMLFVQNYIPAATVWGDGRIVWTAIDEDGKRSVWEGQLAADSIIGFVKDAAQEGFFNWKDLYEDRRVADAATKCLTISLLDLKKSVCEYFEGAPQAFHQLYDVVAEGAGAQNFGPYMPETGYLTALEMTFEEPPTPDQIHADWDAASLNLSLADAANGVWVEGQALAAAWDIVNRNIWANVVHDNGRYFQLTLQIPGLSFTEPPAQ